MTSQALLELAEWLIKVEWLAGEFYVLAEFKFQHDRLLADFFSDCSQDEDWHRQALHNAIQLFPAEEALHTSVLVDQQIRDRIEKPFHRMIERLKSEPVSDQEVISFIAEAEFSEWNHIFLYVVGSLTKASREFDQSAAKIQSHLRRVMDFIEATDYGRDQLRRLKQIPPVWEESILVVDDDELIRNLLRNVLKSEGNVDVAENGRQGLDLLQHKYYKVIVSDIDMPELNGIEFFKKAAEIYPNLGRRFLFVSAKTNSFDLDDLDDEAIERLPKPFLLQELMGKVKQMMSRLDSPAKAGRTATLTGKD